MFQFSPITIANKNFTMRELSFDEIIKVARISEKLNEKRITAFLGYAIGNLELAQKLTIQERYYLLMQYLSTQQDELTGQKSDYQNYLKPVTEAWQTSIKVDSLITVRQLTGYQAEILECVCDDVVDWLTGAMALQMDCPEWPIMPDDTQPADKIDAVMRERIDLIKGLPDSDFDLLCDQYLIGVGQMSSLVDTVFDNDGIVVVCHGLGGADDAPRRFRPSAAFGRRSRELAKHLDQQSSASQQGQQHESA